MYMGVHVGFSDGHGSAGELLNLMLLEVTSNLTDCVISYLVVQ